MMRATVTMAAFTYTWRDERGAKFFIINENSRRYVISFACE
jgi:hypothetical protein